MYMVVVPALLLAFALDQAGRFVPWKLTRVCLEIVALQPGRHTIGILSRAKRSTKLLFGLKLRPRPFSLEEQVYAEVVRDGDVCFDIGAHKGSVSIFLARAAGVAGKVVAFEPAWPMYMAMCANIQSNVDLRAPIFTVPFGLAECEKTANLNVPHGDFGMGSLAQPEAWGRVHPRSELSQYECRFISLDGFLRSKQGLEADFWKIDVEGAELYVLRGASQHFAGGNRPLILAEVYAPWEEAFGYGPWEFISLLLDLGYRFLFLCPGGLMEHSPSESSPFPKEFEHGYMALAYVPERHSERIRGLERLRFGTGKALYFERAIYPNRLLPK